MFIVFIVLWLLIIIISSSISLVLVLLLVLLFKLFIARPTTSQNCQALQGWFFRTNNVQSDTDNTSFCDYCILSFYGYLWEVVAQ